MLSSAAAVAAVRRRWAGEQQKLEQKDGKDNASAATTTTTTTTTTSWSSAASDEVVALSDADMDDCLQPVWLEVSNNNNKTHQPNSKTKLQVVVSNVATGVAYGVKACRAKMSSHGKRVDAAKIKRMRAEEAWAVVLQTDAVVRGDGEPGIADLGEILENLGADMASVLVWNLDPWREAQVPAAQ